jgi:pentatricopeptide repeat protein
VVFVGSLHVTLPHRAVFDSMAVAGIKPNVVTYTTLLKGYCDAGQIETAGALLGKMLKSKPKVVPNLRTVNTYLRGCLRVGAVESAEQVFGRSRFVVTCCTRPTAHLHLRSALFPAVPRCL